MTTELVFAGIARFATELLARAFSHERAVLVIPANVPIESVVDQLAREVERLTDSPPARLVVQSPDRLIEALARAGPDLAIVRLDTDWTPSEWHRLDQIRARLPRRSFVLVLTEAQFSEMTRSAPQSASFFDSLAVSLSPDEAEMTEPERSARLEAFRQRYGKTDDEVIEMARRGEPLDLDYGEWLVLLGCGDLL